MKSPGPLDRRAAFALRLMLALAFALVAVGVAQYTLVARTLTGTALDDLERAHSADAAVLQELGKGPEPMKSVAALLGHMSSRPGVEQVVLLDAAGEPAAAGRPAHGQSADPTQDASESGMPAGGMPASDMPGGEMPSGAMDGMPAELTYQPDAATARQVLRTSRSRAELADTAHGHIRVWVPVTVSGTPYVLEVVRDGGDLQENVGTLRMVVLSTLALGLLLVPPLFYLAGGRSLLARHGEAIEESTTDALTGLGNHRAFHDALRREIGLAQRHDRRVSVALVDLDGFKAVNDARGHAEGDRVLAAVGMVLRAGRPGDQPYRLGGDEFAVILPETDAAGAWVAAERIRREIESEVDGVTASIGLAELSVAAPDAPTLMEFADAALYAAKAAGRNTIADAAIERLPGTPTAVSRS